MASEAKKVRIFEPDCLTEEEKIYAAKLKKSSKFNSQTPRYKIFFLRQFIFGVGVINLLLGKNQVLVLSMIISFLSAKEFVKLAACADPTLLKYFWYENSQMLQKFKRENCTLEHFHFYYPSKERLLAIKNGEDLLREYYVLRKPKLNWKIDCFPNCSITCLSFNPVHDLLALVSCGDITVIAYAGRVRKENGQIIFTTRVSDRYYGINWSPSGEYLLAMRGNETTVISFFWYNPKKKAISEVSTFGSFEMCNGLNTKYLWVDGSTAMFASAERYVMTILKINGEERRIKMSQLNLMKTMTKLDQAVTVRTFRHIVSNFFILPDPNSNFFYFIVMCGKPGHQHHRIIYVDKITLEVVKWINLPGETVEISVSSERFYVLIQERREESYLHNQPILSSDVKNLVQDFSECTFSDSWRLSNKITVKTANVKIVVCDETSVANFHQRCFPGHKLEGVYYNLEPDSNKVYEKIKKILFSISSSNKMYITKDYLYYNSEISRMSQIYGIHHEFKFSTERQLWLHPSIPIAMQKIDAYSSIFYLIEKLATEEEKKKFKKIKEFEYKAKTFFSLTGPNDPLTGATN